MRYPPPFNHKASYMFVFAAVLLGGFLFLVPLVRAESFAPLSEISSLYSDSSLVSYYNFDGNASDTAPAGHDNNGSVTSISYGTSQSGFDEDAEFNGSSGIVLPALGISGNHAFSVWLWFNSSSTTTNALLFNLGGDNGCFNSVLMTLNDDTAGAGSMAVNFGCGDDDYTASNVWTQNAWHNVVFTFSGGSTSNAKIYLDGVQLTTAAGSGNSPSFANGSSNIGNGLGGSGHYTGDMDDLAVFNRALTATEVSELYDATGEFYAQVENAAYLNLRDGTSTSASILKTLPADWIIYVNSTTDQSGDPIINDGYMWYNVVDPTDGTTGWMAASDTSYQYISSYDGGSQAALEASSSDQIATGTASGETGDYVLSAIDNYYNESTTVNSLYSNNDDTGVNANTATPPGGNLQSDISILDQRGYPEKVVLAIAALEDGGTGFNNQIVTRDYGHGIMQVTPSILYYEQHDGNDYSSTNDPRGIASGVTIPPCASYMTSTYTNCYADSGGGDGSDAHSYIPDTSVSGSPTFLQYTNTPQSIYANVKDGMQILASKYGTTEGYSTRVCDNYPDPVTISSTVDYATTTYSCTDEEIIDLTAAYNGSSSPYLSEVATALTDIGDYFPSVTSTDASTTDIINKLNIANYNSVYFALHSPGDLSVQDTHGHTIGVVNGVVTDTFPFATYDPTTKSGYIFFPQDKNLTYKVTGTGTGVYGLDIDITSGTQRIAFHRDENVPITPGEVHTYTINANMIAQGKSGVTLKIDKKGNGTINETDQLGATMTSVVEPKSLPLPSIPFIPIKLPLPVKKKIPTPIFVNPINSTFTLPISTATFNSSTFYWNIVTSTISTSSTK